MITIASTRFNKQTWNENCSYREKRKLPGCIYCSPLPLSSRISPNSLLFVIEMNNSRNKIEGIGLIHNYLQIDKYYVYDNGNYNRYIYKSNYRIDRTMLKHYNTPLVNILDHILFKEKTHLKRGSGITTVPDKLLRHSVCSDINIKDELITIFKNHFRLKSDTNLDAFPDANLDTKPAEKKELKKEHYPALNIPP